MTDPVFQEANRWLATPFVWGETDCMLMLADWVVAQTGCADPCAAIRGIYRDPVGCEQLTGFLSSPMTVMGWYAVRAGLQPTAVPRRGDIGLVSVALAGRRALVCGALCLGTHWLLRTEADGAWVLAHDRVTLRAAWHVPVLAEAA